jgi:hypothetical protein
MRRIREGDTTTPFWFPAQTTSGAIREDRLVLPIPPQTHWRDVMPVILPGGDKPKLEDQNPKQIERPKPKVPIRRFVQFGPPGTNNVQPVVEKSKREKPKHEKVKNDPKHVAAARELRDRWLEKVNSSEGAFVLVSDAKYEVNKALGHAGGTGAGAKHASRPLLTDGLSVAA